MLRLSPLRVLVAVALVAGSVGVVAWQPSTRPAAQRPRALWLWDPDPDLTDASIRTTFLDFLVRENIGTVWAQIGLERTATPAPTQSSTASKDASPRTAASTGPSAPTALRRLKHEAQWRSLLADAHRRHIRFEALDGDPTYALEIYHHVPIAVVDAVLAFNLQGRSDERFDGIHFDNEPYLLLAWRFKTSRESLLREFLELNETCLAKVHTQPGMEFGIDIPYWWQSIDDRTGRPIGDVTYKGVRKAASYHLIDRLDNVGIMDYRNKAEGTDGIVSHALDLLAYADEGRRAKIWVGVETSLSTPSDVWFVVGQPSNRMEDLLRDPSNGISRDNRFGDFKLRTYEDGDNTHVGLQLPARLAAGQPPAAFLSALTRLARTFGAAAHPASKLQTEAIRNRLLRSLARDGEWQEPALRMIPDRDTGTEHVGVLATSIMLPKLTFSGLPASTLRRELSLAEQGLLKFGRYAGIALHHYDSYREIVATEGK